MTETTTSGATERSIAEIVKEGKKPTEELFELSNEAARLGHAIKVAEVWMDAATTPDVPGEMLEQAEAMHDELEQELSRVAFRMNVIRATQLEQAVNEERPEEERVEDAERVSRLAHLADQLANAYNVLAIAPLDIFGVEGAEASPATRYGLMGALLEAREAVDEEYERLVEFGKSDDITAHHKERARRGYQEFTGPGLRLVRPRPSHMKLG